MKVSRTIEIITITLCLIAIAGCRSEKRSPAGTTLGEIKATSADVEKASILRAIDRKFDDADNHYKLGKVYQNDAMWSQAEHEFNTALRFEPAHRSSQAAMIKVLKQSGNETRANLYADIYINQVASTAKGSLMFGLALQREALDEHALYAYQQALRLAPNSAKVNRQIGYYYLTKNDQIRAGEYLRRSFDLNPNQPDVAGQLGRMGVQVSIPRKSYKKSGKSLDRMIDKSDKELRMELERSQRGQ